MNFRVQHFNVGDEVIFKSDETKYKEWHGKIGRITDTQFVQMGTKQFVRVSFDQKNKYNYLDVGSWRLHRAHTLN
jgi:hypothetical protein